MADRELCLEAAEAMVDASEAESRAGRINTLADRLEARLAAAESAEKRQAILNEFSAAVGEDAPKRGRKKKEKEEE